MGHMVNIRIWEPIQPAARASRYEYPLISALQSKRLGEVAGTSVSMNRELEIEFVEYDLRIFDLESGIDTVKLVLETAGAPAGSEFRIAGEEGEKIIRFGRQEGLAIYLDGINLPDRVYDTCTCDALAALFYDELTAASGEIRGSWVGRSETCIYLYGPNAEHVYAAIEPILAVYPLCQNARVVIRHGNPELNPRTVRFPFHEAANGAGMLFKGAVHGSG